MIFIAKQANRFSTWNLNLKELQKHTLTQTHTYNLCMLHLQVQYAGLSIREIKSKDCTVIIFPAYVKISIKCRHFALGKLVTLPIGWLVTLFAGPNRLRSWYSKVIVISPRNLALFLYAYLHNYSFHVSYKPIIVLFSFTFQLVVKSKT